MTEEIKRIFVSMCNVDTETKKGMDIVDQKICKILELQAKKNPNIRYNNEITKKYPFMEKCSK